MRSLRTRFRQGPDPARIAAILVVLVGLGGWTLALAELSGAGPLRAMARSQPPSPSARLVAPAPTPTATVRPTLTPAPTPEQTPEALEAEGSAEPEEKTPPPSPSPTRVPPFVEQRVQAGQTLSSIAAEYGVSVDAIALANQLAVDKPIFEGQLLVIPRLRGVIHRVGDGESVSAIAELYAVGPGAIIEANRLNDQGLIFVGQRLLVPGALALAPTSTPTPKPPTPTPSPTAPPATATPTPPTATSTPLPAQSFRVPVWTPVAPPRGSGGPGARLAWPSTGGLSQLFAQGHTGIDIMRDMGDPVAAAADGMVILVVESDFGYGNRIEIDHGSGLSTLYAHLSAISVTVGQRVSRGQSIGAVGDTGFSFGPHLHFEVRVGNVPTDPLRYLP